MLYLGANFLFIDHLVTKFSISLIFICSRHDFRSFIPWNAELAIDMCYRR